MYYTRTLNGGQLPVIACAPRGGYGNGGGTYTFSKGIGAYDDDHGGGTITFAKGVGRGPSLADRVAHLGQLPVIMGGRIGSNGDSTGGGGGGGGTGGGGGHDTGGGGGGDTTGGEEEGGGGAIDLSFLDSFSWNLGDEMGPEFEPDWDRHPWLLISDAVRDWFTIAHGPQDFLDWIRANEPQALYEDTDAVRLAYYTWLRLTGKSIVWGHTGIGDRYNASLYKPGFTEQAYATLGIDYWPSAYSHTAFGGPGFREVPLFSGSLPTTEQMAAAIQQTGNWPAPGQPVASPGAPPIPNVDPPGGGFPIIPGTITPPPSGGGSTLSGLLPLALLFIAAKGLS